MTDSEIVKALECCLITYDCINCPANRDDNKYKYMDSYVCKGVQKRDMFDLINRQQAEIERLKGKSEPVASGIYAIPHRAISDEDIERIAEKMRCDND